MNLLLKYIAILGLIFVAVSIDISAQKSRKTPQNKQKSKNAGVGYVPTPPETVTAMLRVANIKKTDLLYDLGSGDGRIPIEAAKTYGIRAVGIEVEPELIKLARENAEKAGASDLVKFEQTDLFKVDLRKVDVVTLYLSDKINLRLLPKLLRELKIGSRIVSHDFKMGDWKPEQSLKVPWENLYRNVYLWTIPTNRRVPGQIQRKKRR
ncbi:MAG: methyltransferase domain-containing protein [Pyrinomonadaceae bacterium]|nr:methyltransferase domain-containing protein [Pyrinomonadaceae bacterium]